MEALFIFILAFSLACSVSGSRLLADWPASPCRKEALSPCKRMHIYHLLLYSEYGALYACLQPGMPSRRTAGQSIRQIVSFLRFCGIFALTSSRFDEPLTIVRGFGGPMRAWKIGKTVRRRDVVLYCFCKPFQPLTHLLQKIAHVPSMT